MAILGQTRLEFAHTFDQHTVLLEQQVEPLPQFSVFGFQGGGFVVRWHAPMVHPLHNSTWIVTMPVQKA